MRAGVLLLAFALTQPACGGVTRNQRTGLIGLGGVAVLMGGLMTIDGAYCSGADDPSTARNCRQDDRGDLAIGIPTLLGGLLLVGGAFMLHPRD